ncbi:MAG: choice-of-anchor B family protein [Chloroflexi bacterium]|nr:choice-of-anchor B family protein [Chloroflexota bacterium]MBP8054689.1 choice-of-anchor B family protein [Chloroflexota bacterium]
MRVLNAQESPLPAPESDLVAYINAGLARDHQEPDQLTPLGATPCVGGTAAGYPCQNVDLLSFMPLNTIGGGEGSANWGWTDTVTGREFAIMGRSNGTAFVEITNPTAPVYLGNLPSHTSSSSWRELKTYSHYVFIVSDNNGSHGMQVFDLGQLLAVTTPPVTFSESAHYAGVGAGHTITVNDDTGYAYILGSNTCSGGLHMVNVQTALLPTFAGCFSSDGYTHDAQCVIYNGPDVAHQGKEICFAYNTDTLTIVDVTNKSAPVQISRTGYTGRGYTHQGWLTDDQQYLTLDDELDENNFGHNTRTYMWDVRNLDAPTMMGYHQATTAAIDHNQFFLGDYLFQANYRAGMRILDGTNIANGQLAEIGYFDIYPANNNASFNGAWHVYPYFASGVVIVSGIEQGLFMLDPHLPNEPNYLARLLNTASTANAAPGHHATHSFVIENLGDEDSYTLAISGNAWSTTLMTGSPITVTAGVTATIEVEVHVPAAAAANHDTFTLTLTSTHDANLVMTATGITSFNQVFFPALIKP